MRAIQKIRESIKEEVFSYTQVIETLKGYKKPRDVINTLLKNGDIIRVKKGLYVFGEIWRKKPYSRELLANLIYGPSVISTDYVLSGAGLIPEQVKTITSVTTGRSRSFSTPVGKFTYKQLNKERLSFGIEINKTNGEQYFSANPLKALADKIWLDKRFKPTSPKSYEAYLFDDLRIDPDVLKNYFDKNFIEQLNAVYSARKINWFVEFLKREFSIK
jgi:predicted transcriptional regulator of viral defense system